MSKETGKCDSCKGALARVTDTTAHDYYKHTLLDCQAYERDAAPARAEARDADLTALLEVLHEAGVEAGLLNHEAFAENVRAEATLARVSELEGQVEALRESLDWSIKGPSSRTPFWTSSDKKHHCGICNPPPQEDRDNFSHEPDCKWQKAIAILTATAPESTDPGEK